MSTTTANSRPFGMTIGQKVVMALTGLFLCTFLVSHLSGNLLLLINDGGETFNAYAEFMRTNPLIRIVEIVLFLAIPVHVIYAYRLQARNRAARPVGYVMNRPAENSTFYSRFMVWGGTLLLFFILLHLWHFFFQHRIVGSPLTMYDEVVAVLSNPFYSGVYILAQVFLAWHLCHGFQSAFQTLGVQINSKTGKFIKSVGYGFGIVVPAGFAAIPLYFLLRQVF